MAASDDKLRRSGSVPTGENVKLKYAVHPHKSKYVGMVVEY
jgi:hypothetical protein